MSNPCDSIVSARVVAKSVRRRVSVDLRSLGPIVHAHAAARGIALSALIRLAVSSALEISPDLAASGAPVASRNTDTKLTLRLRCDVAQHLARRAKCSGLSYGDYVTMLLNGLNPSTATDHRLAVEALGRSTALLAPALADLKNVARCAGSLSHRLETHQIDQVAQAIHHHLVLASKLMAELRPMAARRRPSKQVR